MGLGLCQNFRRHSEARGRERSKKGRYAAGAAPLLPAINLHATFMWYSFVHVFEYSYIHACNMSYMWKRLYGMGKSTTGPGIDTVPSPAMKNTEAEKLHTAWSAASFVLAGIS